MAILNAIQISNGIARIYSNVRISEEFPDRIIRKRMKPITTIRYMKEF